MSLHERLKKFNTRGIHYSKIKPRWFRNWYCFYQARGMFRHYYYTFNVTCLPVNAGNFDGTWYGPFWSEAEASDFGKDLVDTYWFFLTG